MHVNDSNIKNAKIFIIILLICFVFIGAVINKYKPEIYDRLSELGLLPAKERFTELYFDNLLPLFAEMTGGINIDSSFTIHNVEGEDREYSYLVYYKLENGNIEMVDQNTVFVKNNEKRTIKKSVFFLNSKDKVIVYVDLPDLKQKIHFIINNK